MYRIKSFSNAQEFQELFGVQEHGNGVKSRKNKILHSLLFTLHLFMAFLKLTESLFAELSILLIPAALPPVFSWLCYQL